MKIERKEIAQGVFLNHLYSDKFKTAFMSFTFLSQLCRENASMNALIPFVLHRGTRTYGDMEQISNRLDELYGTAVEPSVRRLGEIQGIGLVASFPETVFLPSGENILKDVIGFASEMLLHPATRGGLLLPKYVDSEKQNLIDLIRSRINEKRSYAMTRCIEEMCCYEDYSVGRFGSEDDCQSINYKKLTARYREVIQTCPLEIFYCGRAAVGEVVSLLKDAFSLMPRGEIDYDIGTDIRMNSVEEEPRFFTEELNVTQGKLVMGYRLGEVMEDPDYAAISVFNAVFGSGVTSKLFMNVREKLSLCYYASSTIDKKKGIMLVNSGIEFDKFDEAKAEIIHQLDEVRSGNITDDELRFAKKSLVSDCASMLDAPPELENYYLSQIISGMDVSPEEMAELIGFVTKEDVVRIANSVECDLIYFLKGGSNDENEED